MSNRKQIILAVLLMAAAVAVGLAVPLAAGRLKDAAFDNTSLSLDIAALDKDDTAKLGIDEKLRLLSSRDIYIIDTDEGRDLDREEAAKTAEGYLYELYALGIVTCAPENMYYDIYDDVCPVVLIDESGRGDGLLAWSFVANGDDGSIVMFIDDESSLMLGMSFYSNGEAVLTEDDADLIDSFAEYCADKLGGKLMEIEYISNDVSYGDLFRFKISFDDGFTYVPLDLRLYESHMAFNME